MIRTSSSSVERIASLLRDSTCRINSGRPCLRWISQDCSQVLAHWMVHFTSFVVNTVKKSWAQSRSWSIVGDPNKAWVTGCLSILQKPSCTQDGCLPYPCSTVKRLWSWEVMALLMMSTQALETSYSLTSRRSRLPRKFKTLRDFFNSKPLETSASSTKKTLLLPWSRMKHKRKQWLSSLRREQKWSKKFKSSE